MLDNDLSRSNIPDVGNLQYSPLVTQEEKHDVKVKTDGVSNYNTRTKPRFQKRKQRASCGFYTTLIFTWTQDSDGVFIF